MKQEERRIARPILFAVAMGAFLAQLDGTVMNVALPTLSHTFRVANLSDVQPVITAYLVAYVALLPILGKLADRVGRKALFLTGFAIFGLASVLCALSNSLGVLIALRIVQASGGALLSTTSLALIAAYTGSSRGRALGQLSIVFALSGLIGPPLGGGLVQAFGWQSVFWLNVPLAAVGLFIGARLLPRDVPTGARGSIDFLGSILFAAGTTLITIGAATARENGPTVLGAHLPWPLLVLAGLLGYAALLRWDAAGTQHGVDTLLNVPLLRTPAYGIGLIAGFLSNGLTIGLFVLVPFWLTRGWGIGASTIGLIFLPVALGLGGLASFAGKRAEIIGPRMLTTTGMLLGACAAILLAWQATLLLWPVVLVAMLLLGAGSGLFAAPNNMAVLGAAPDSELAVAGSMLSAARTLGVIVGVSVAGSGFDLLRAGSGPNAAARYLFLLAAAFYAFNALICWTAGERHQQARAPLPGRQSPRVARSRPGIRKSP